MFKVFCLLISFTLIEQCITSKDQLIDFSPDTEDFDLIASESVKHQQNSEVIDLTTDSYLQECLEALNEKRRLHGVEDLVYSEKLLNDAKEAAFQSAINGKLTRIEDSPYGENLAASTKRLTCGNSINLWYKQQKQYSYHVPAYSNFSGGFTQIVWRETKRFACAQSRLKTPGSRYYTVCVFDPFGNVSGQFRANVLPPISIQSENRTLNSSTSNKTLNSLTSNKTSATPIQPISFDRTTMSNLNNIIILPSNKSDSNLNSNRTITITRINEESSHEATLNVSPYDSNLNGPSASSQLVKPILNRARLSPGMLMKLKNLRKSHADERSLVKENTNDILEASASELNLFVQHNIISPTLNTMEISNLIKRNDNIDESIIAESTAVTLTNGEDVTTTTLKST